MADWNPAPSTADLRPPVSGRTRLAAVIGAPVRHSLSPTLLNAAFATTGLDWAYLAFEVPDGGATSALQAMRTLGFGGLSVTMPHKAAVAAAVDCCTPEAEALGAVNCVVADDGMLVGHNTDGGGFIDGLSHDTGLDMGGRRAVVLGAGGAARAVIRALGEAGAAEVAVVNRTRDRAVGAAALAGSVGRVVDGDDTAGALANADLVVNATPLGMAGTASGTDLPVDPKLVPEGAVAVDLIYHPVETAWMAALRRRGIEVHGGLSMLVFQAARAFVLWTGKEAPVETMATAARSALVAR
ncbi:MAG: shikimate dehydrogenase [Actinomycetota bacterium]|nr:shikimate dehydrogenase [Actinomycetota bacterium]MEC9395682.1 shikimate dehydrogenase [Actinomycetota bacterium]MEE2957980.1 shikimate dehydrogenase [Actinomycetota bacterium]